MSLIKKRILFILIQSTEEQRGCAPVATPPVMATLKADDDMDFLLGYTRDLKQQDQTGGEPCRFFVVQKEQYFNNFYSIDSNVDLTKATIYLV